VITPETLTDEMIRNAQDACPESISSEVAADALGLPLGPYDGGVPADRRKFARECICDAINARTGAKP
jgi:hypothetical protein